MRLLFYTDTNADHTLYNIAISYVAAYIFYLIQVYYPEKRKTKIAIIQTKQDMYNCLHQCKIFIEGWKAYTNRNSEKSTIVGVNVHLLYYQDFYGHIVQMTKKCLEETVQRILEDYDKIKENIDFRNSDIELQKLFLDMDFAEQANEWYQSLLFAEILCDNPNSTIMESYSERDLMEFELRIMKLAMLYRIDECLQLEETTDKENIILYHKVMGSVYSVAYENKECFHKIPEGYNKPLRKK